MIPSESMTVLSSKATLAGRAGFVPVAITMFAAGPAEPPAAVVHLDFVGRDGPRVEADAAEHVRPFHHGDPAVQLGGRDRRLLAARAGADHQHVVAVHGFQCGRPARQIEAA
jgi:hypothetical protein